MTNHYLSPPQRIQLAEKNLERITSWITMSDTKTGIIIAFQAGMTAFLSTKGQEIVNTLALHRWEQIPIFISLLLFACFLSWSVYAAFKSLYPDTKLRRPSPFFFGSIATMGQNKYKKTMQSLTEEATEEELNDQVYITSEIASAKFNYIKTSIKTLFITSIFWLIVLTFLPNSATNSINCQFGHGHKYDSIYFPSKR